MGKRAMRAAGAAVLLCGGLVVLSPGTAWAIDGCQDEQNTAGSVDGRELAYESATSFGAQLDQARDAWNALGRIRVRRDDALTFADLKVSDVDRGSVTWSGLWSPSTGTDQIYLNKYYLRKYNENQRRGVISHELGHALRLGHVNDREALLHCSDARTAYTPQFHDKEMYRSIWEDKK